MHDMEIERETEVKAPIEKLWEIIEHPDASLANAGTGAEAEDLGDGRYRLRTPVKLGLFKIKLECVAHFKNKRPPVHSDVEFSVKLPGGKVDGSGGITLEALDAERTLVRIALSGSSGGVLSKMLGGGGASSGRLEGLADTIIGHMERQASSK